MSSGRAFAVYTSLRVLILLVVGGVLYLLGARSFLLIALAFLVSGALSLILLDRPRSQASQGFGRLIGRVNAKIDAAAAKEDPVEDESLDQRHSSDGEPDSETEAGQHQGK